MSHRIYDVEFGPHRGLWRDMKVDLDSFFESLSKL